MNFDEMRHKYENDPEFNRVVNYMYHLMYQNEINVSLLKSAAVFAAFKFESEHVRQISMPVIKK